MLYRICLFAFFVVLVGSCGKKKKTMAGEEEVNLQEFVDFFSEIELPFTYSDSALYVKTNDSLLISPEVFTQFTPDSILKASFGTEKPKLYAIGKFKEKNGTTYLLSKAATPTLKVMFINAYNTKNEYLAGFEAMRSKNDRSVSASITIDKLYNIDKKTKKILSNNIEISGDDVFVLNSSAKKFMLVMTDALGDEADVFNPIDTLGRTYKHAGDYGVGSRNIISIRDNAKESKVNFFIHLEEKNSNCKGELKGEANIVSEKILEYRTPGDPCVLQFIFDNNSVTLKEVEGCGSRMGALDCTFNGRYTKKKLAKSSTEK